MFVTTALVTSVCLSKRSIVISGLPASVHALLRAVTSSSCTVAFCTATFLPQASSALMPLGLPAAVAHWVPALK